MSNIPELGPGGAFLKPSARPSIHNHRGCLFAEGENMVRYGIPRNNQNNRSGDDRDEVDNVMSKPAHPIGSPTRQRNRRSSLDGVNNSKYYAAEYDNDVLSKSVPATLPSQLYCSNVSDDEQDEEVENEYHCSDVSYYSSSSPNTSNVSRNNSNTHTPKLLNSTIIDRDNSRIIDRDNSRINKDKENKSSSSKVKFSLVGIAIAACAVMCSGRVNVTQMSTANIYDENMYYRDTSRLGEKFNVGEDAILQVQAAISAISRKQDAASFIFVYNSKSKKFNLNEFDNFVNNLSHVTSKYLRNDSTPLDYVVLEGTKLNMEEVSELMCGYRDLLTDSGVMLVRHLQAVPAHLAMAFHYYCDENYPLVKKSAIFFTLDLDKCSPSDDKSLHSTAEKCLADKWRGSVSKDSLVPLLTRVVNVVVDVTSAF